MTDTDMSTEGAGWDAIETALKAIYGDQTPLQWGTVVKYSLGGPDPIDGISAYRHDGETPHWHLVTFGFSELYAKESENPDVSGYGIELTFRLPILDGETAPPVWALNFLQNLGRYVFNSGNIFAAGHHMNLNGPICIGSDTEIKAVLFDVDPELGSIRTPNGAVTFLQVVGVTLDELAAAKTWDTRKLLGIMAQRAPLLVTDLKRRSMLGIDETRSAVVEGSARDGSSTAGMYVGAAAFALEHEGRVLRLTLGANGVEDIFRVLRGRIPFGQEFVVASSSAAITFVPSDYCGWEAVGEQGVRVGLTADAANGLADAIRVTAGGYSSLEAPGLMVEVVRTQITDGDGNVVQIIG